MTDEPMTDELERLGENVHDAIKSARRTLVRDEGGAFWTAAEHRQNALEQLEFADEHLPSLLSELKAAREALRLAKQIDWRTVYRMIDGQSLPMDMQPMRERLLRDLDRFSDAVALFADTANETEHFGRRRD